MRACIIVITCLINSDKVYFVQKRVILSTHTQPLQSDRVKSLPRSIFWKPMSNLKAVPQKCGSTTLNMSHIEDMQVIWVPDC